MRNKLITNDEVREIAQYSGQPVELALEARPQWMSNLPSARVFASGIASSTENWLSIEVYRDSSGHPEATSGYLWNQDIYSGYFNKNICEINGPTCNPQEHWATEIPQRLSNSPVIDPENQTE